MVEFDAEEWVRGASRRTATVEVCRDQAAVAEMQEATAALQAARRQEKDMLSKPLSQEAEARFNAALERWESATQTFTLQALTPTERRKLAAQHPPTEDQRKRNRQVDVNQDTYWPALFAKCSVDPEVSPSGAKAIMDLHDTIEADVVQTLNDLHFGKVDGDFLRASAAKAATDAPQGSGQSST